MAKRKTFDVAELVDMVNDICRFSINDSKEHRQGAMSVVEEVLHRTGNYKGFRYLMPYEMEAGYTSGINVDDDGQICRDYEKRFADTDNTRVQYAGGSR